MEYACLLYSGTIICREGLPTCSIKRIKQYSIIVNQLDYDTAIVKNRDGI